MHKIEQGVLVNIHRNNIFDRKIKLLQCFVIKSNRVSYYAPNLIISQYLYNSEGSDASVDYVILKIESGRFESPPNFKID